MRKLDDLIPLAINAAESTIQKDGEISKEYQGYASSFGVAAREGLKPAIAFFENKNAASQQDRTKLMKAILIIVCTYRGIDDVPDTLMEYVLSSDNQDLVEQDILDAAIALKLAIRTFRLT